MNFTQIGKISCEKEKFYQELEKAATYQLEFADCSSGAGTVWRAAPK